MAAQIADFSPKKINLKVTAGDDIVLPVTVKQDGDPVDLTDYVFRCQFRESDGTLVYDLTEGDGITVYPLLGKFDIIADGAETIGYDCETELKYDIDVVNPEGNRRTWIAGICTVSPQITANS